MLNLIKHTLLLVIILITSSCSQVIHQSFTTTPARIGAETEFHKEFKELPRPKEKLIAAVYKFRDQTGQYKPTENGSSWSTAVTQGATTILIRTLEESGWFRPLERENLGNLSAERQIITNTLATYEGKNATALSPLLFAGIILEGGIISYETNVRTGGMGARYFGTGASGQYREDRVSIYLRAVSTRNGEILKTVYASKNILSQQIDFGIFRYVSFKHLLEAETGVTYNEPSEMAVTEAIEKCVYSLILEGMLDHLWYASSPDEQNEIVEKYSAEKENNAQIDHLGRRIYNKNSMLGIGINTGFTRFDTDAWPVRPGFNTALNTYIKLNPASAFNTDLSIGRSSSFYIDNFDYEAFSSYITFNFLPKERLSPNISLGYGIYHNKTSNLFNTESKYFTFFHTSYGFEYLIDRSFKINFGIKNRYFTNDLLDNTTHGKYNDMIWEGYCGVNYLFGTRWRKTSLFKRKSISYEKNN